MNDDLRARILARRAAFVAAALAGLAGAGACGTARDSRQGGATTPPGDTAEPPDAAPVEPRVCLTK